MLKRTLIQIGFTSKEAKIYLSLLKAGPSLIQEIADLTKIKRTTLYGILKAMVKKGWISISITGKRKKYQAEEPAKILAYLKQKQTDFANILPALTGLTKKEVSFKPVIKFYYGQEGIKAIYQDSLLVCSKGDEILCYGGAQPAMTMMPKHTQEYVKKRAALGIRLRGITHDTKEGRAFKQNDAKELGITKLVPKERFNIAIEKIIYKDKIMIASYRGYLMAVLIQSKELARAERAIFELIWGSID